jgi:regulator of sigma E protease
MFDFLWNLASFILALGILVTVHEYGHFWVARKCGVKVERFSIGFGKALWRSKDKQGTEYVIAAIPLGGYVKMLDERVDNVKPEDKDKTFNVKSVYQRIAIIAAGPMANFAFAIFAFYLMFLIGVPSIKPIIGSVEQQSIAAKANLPVNAEIVEVSGHSTLDWQDVNMALVGNIGHKSIEIKTKTADSQYLKTVTLDTSAWKFSPDKQSAMTSLGINPYQPKVYAEIALIQAGSPAEKSGLKIGDKLVSLDGENIEEDWQKFSTLIKQYPDTNVELEIIRDGLPRKLVIRPGIRETKTSKIGFLGVVPKHDSYPEQYRVELSYGPIDSLTQGVARTWRLVTLSFDMIGKLITGDVSVKNLSGPIAIAQGAGSSANIGLVYFLGFLALISVNLGIINLLPLPVLDGGHLLYYFIELLTGKPVPEKVQEIGFRFGALALLGLMSIAIFNDLSRL